MNGELGDHGESWEEPERLGGPPLGDPFAIHYELAALFVELVTFKNDVELVAAAINADECDGVVLRTMCEAPFAEGRPIDASVGGIHKGPFPDHEASNGMAAGACVSFHQRRRVRAEMGN